MLMVTAVRRALAELTIAPADKAAAELALTYARRIDGIRDDGGELVPGDLSKLGPPLLAVLEALGMTPRARAAQVKGAKDERQPEPDRKPVNPLDELRQRREQRAG